MSARKNPRNPLQPRGNQCNSDNPWLVTLQADAGINPFGEVSDGRIRLCGAGKMIERTWLDLPNRFPTLELGSFSMFPNGLRGVLTLRTPRRTSPGPTVERVVGAYKSLTTVRYLLSMKEFGWVPVAGRLWQEAHRIVPHPLSMR